jgi:hypothetical protein
MYLPIAAEAEAASRAVAQLPAGTQDARAQSQENVENLPAQVQPSGEVEPHDERATPLIPSIPDATKAAARWIRPLVPPFVARVIDTTTQPLRTARQVFEEVEEITFSLKRTRKVTVNSESSDGSDQPPRQSTTAEPLSPTDRIASSREDRDYGTQDQPSRQTYNQVGSHEQYASLQLPAKDVEGLSLGSAEGDSKLELMERDGPRELRSPEGPRQLPPPK